MTDEYLFISDCHLDADQQAITNQLTEFLQNRASKARFLYILGDLFETWLGDDDPAVDLSSILRSFKDLSDNTEIFFLAGNRDFLFHGKGAERIGAQIITEPTILSLDSQRIALVHGDSLCTDDSAYQQFRKMVRHSDWQDDFLSKSLMERQQIADTLREQSKAAMQGKAMSIMDVSQETVIASFAELDVDVIIHGHTHRPGIHHYDNNRTRYVLGDWNPQPSYLSWRADTGFVLTDPRV